MTFFGSENDMTKYVFTAEELHELSYYLADYIAEEVERGSSEITQQDMLDALDAFIGGAR